MLMIRPVTELGGASAPGLLYAIVANHLDLSDRLILAAEGEVSLEFGWSIYRYYLGLVNEPNVADFVRMAVELDVQADCDAANGPGKEALTRTNLAAELVELRACVLDGLFGCAREHSVRLTRQRIVTPAMPNSALQAAGSPEYATKGQARALLGLLKEL